MNSISGYSYRGVISDCEYGKLRGVCLLLLHSDITANSEDDRAITRQLHNNGFDTRIRQEVVLGIGGVKHCVKSIYNPIYGI